MPHSPVVERTAFASISTTATLGPILTHHAMSKPSSSNSPVSPDQVSAAMLLRMQISQPPSSGKPPISPPSIQQGVPRMSPMANGSKTALPSLTRLPSLTARPTQPHAHHEPHQIPVHRPSVVMAPQPRGAHYTAATPATPSEAPSPRELAARLALLLHARECCTPLDTERLCGVRNCRVARGVLDHCQECFLPEGQCHRSCSEAKQLLRHFRVCRAQNFQRGCSICDTLRTEFAWAMQHVRSLTPLFVPREDEQPQPHAVPHHYAPQRRHSYQPEHHQGVPTTSLRRSVSEGPHATMSSMGHHKRGSPSVHQSMEPQLPQPSMKRVRIVTPTEEAARAKQ